MIRKNIPNFITLLNLLSGCVSIVFAFNGNLVLAAWLIGLAAIFDFFDGMSARLLNARSPLGMQLDSLSDVVSFGVAPGVIIFQMMQTSQHLPVFSWGGMNPSTFIAFLVPAFSALRLAKFNIDDRQTDSFIGLPTPANALFLASLPLVFSQAVGGGHVWITTFLGNFPALLAITVLFSVLLVSPLPLMAFKFKTYGLKENFSRYIFLMLAVVLFFTVGFYAIPLIVVVYILLSLLNRKRES